MQLNYCGACCRNLFVSTLTCWYGVHPPYPWWVSFLLLLWIPETMDSSKPYKNPFTNPTSSLPGKQEDQTRSSLELQRSQPSKPLPVSLQPRDGKKNQTEQDGHPLQATLTPFPHPPCTFSIPCRAASFILDTVFRSRAFSSSRTLMRIMLACNCFSMSSTMSPVPAIRHKGSHQSRRTGNHRTDRSSNLHAGHKGPFTRSGHPLWAPSTAAAQAG